MKPLRTTASSLVAALLCHGVAAQPAPDFAVAYRAWDAVTDIARHNRDPNISGECGKTFRPFVIPGLKAQTRQEQDLAAAACLHTARSVCANARLQRTADMARKCEEFR
ncbi:MAG TPA: hypothetical protein VLK85_32000 [Ramlibacter sp.]|nr:hypothetical protein [Ramlibacter sp.]